MWDAHLEDEDAAADDANELEVYKHAAAKVVVNGLSRPTALAQARRELQMEIDAVNDLTGASATQIPKPAQVPNEKYSQWAAVLSDMRKTIR
jgi:hypothetical protein